MQTSTVTAANSTYVPGQKIEQKGTDDFETFLTLLTAQMRNQDPLKPMDSTAFVAQLASFSTVEQQIETNAKLDNILSAFSSSSTNQLTEWIGKEVSRDDNLSDTFTEPTFELVTEVRIEQGEVILMFADGTKFRSDDVSSIRIPHQENT